MMSESVDDLILTPRTRIVKEQSARFLRGWEEALLGGEPPEIDAFLETVAEPERARLAGELERIERIYRKRRSVGAASTVFEDPSPELTAATLRLPGNPPPHSVDSEGRSLSALDSDSVHLPLLDSWGNDVVPPPIPGRVPGVFGPRPLLKGYEILGELGRGGMGVVYKANQQGLNRLVAIKMVLGGDHAREEDLARFKIEAEAVASIQHANIVQIYEVGDKDGTPYFSLEYIDGGTLHQKIGGKPLPHDDVAGTVLLLAQAMGHFHERGVIHRDLKPANVLLTRDGTPKITDFGLAKRIEGNSSQTRTGSLMGTPSYMAPEQASGDTHAIGPLSDLYSLGAILYEMLTGRPPFQGATMLDTIDQVRSQEPVPPRRLQPKIPRDLETICLKCLQKDPAKRYAGADELSVDLQRFLEGEPIKARPVGRLEHGWRWVRRNPKLAMMSTAIILLAVMMGSIALASAVRNARETQTINEARRIATERLERGRSAIEAGDVRRAIEIIGAPDPFVERTPSLVEIRDSLAQLRAQLQTFTEFRRLLDLARYHGLRGSRKKLKQGKDYSRDVIALYDEIEARTGRGEFGLPPLSPSQLQLFNEEVFDSFLVAAQFEYDHEESNPDPEVRKKAARTAISWLDRAEKVLPRTRALYVRRQLYKDLVGDQAGSKADKQMGESIQPNSPVDLFWRAHSDRARGDDAFAQKDQPKAREYYSLARDGFARFLQVRPDNFWGELEWAGCHFRLGDYYDAQKGYSTATRLRPDAYWAYHDLAQAHAKVQEFDDVILEETQAIARDPEFLEAYVGRYEADKALGKWDDAVTDLGHVLELDPSRVDLQFTRGEIHLQARRLDAALLDFEAAVAAFPTMAGPYKRRGLTRLLLRDFEGASSDWTKASTILPRDFESHHYLAVIPMGFRRYDEALREFDACLALNPGYALASLAKARIAHWRGNDAEALSLIDGVVARFDRSRWDATTKAAYLNERVDLYRNLGRLDASEADARRSIELDPNQVDAYLALALLEKKRGKPVAEIEEWIARMVATNPKSAAARLRRAEFLRDHGRWDEALADIEKARSLEPSRTAAIFDLVRDSVIAARGDFDLATTQAETSLKKESRPSGPVLYAAACVWSLASRSASTAGDSPKAELFADRATGLLKQALGQGFHDINYQEQERMLSDPALEPIAGRAEVRKLLSFLP